MYTIHKCQIKINKNVDIKFSAHDIHSQNVFGRKKTKVPKNDNQSVKSGVDVQNSVLG